MATRTHSSSDLFTISNVITITRILLVPVFVAALLAPWPEWFGVEELYIESWKRWIAAGIFILISATDWLDGYLARRRNEITDFGKFMDPLADKILVAAALICLVELAALPAWVVLIILAREFIVSGIRMMAASKGVVIAASILGKFKTVFQMIAIVLFTLKDSYVNSPFAAALHDPLWVISWVVMLIALGLTIASLIDYLVKARPLFGFANPALHEGEGAAEEEQELSALAESVILSLQGSDATLATAESLTGGMIGQALTAVSGSSAVFAGGVVSYTNPVKHALLGVPQAVLDDEGAVSEPCARAMAQGARERLGTTFAVSVTGIAGPTGAEPGKPIGTVWIALASAQGTKATCYHFQGDREAVRCQTAEKALTTVLDALL